MAADEKKLLRIKKLLDDIQKQYNKLGEKNPFKVDTKTMGDADTEIKKLEAGLEGVQAKVLRVDTSFNELHKTLKGVVREFNPNSLKASKLLEKGMKGLVSEARKLANEEDDIGSLSKKNLEKIHERAKAAKKMAKEAAFDLIKDIKLEKVGHKSKAAGNSVDSKLISATNKKIDRRRKSYRDLSDEVKAAIAIYHDEGNLQQDLIDKVGNRIKLETKFNKKMGLGLQAAGGLDKALQKMGIPALGIADAAEKAKKEFIKTGGKTKVMWGTLKGVGKNMKGMLTRANALTAAFTMMVKALISVDKESGEFAKNQGISYQRTLKIRGEMSRVALHSKDQLVTSKSLMETQSTLNKYFGQSVVFSGKMAEEFSSIATRTKMTAESQGLFALESMKTGKTAKTLLKGQITQTMELNKQYGLQMSAKQIQDAIGKSSSSLQLTFKGSTKELTKQVMAAKALGVNLETANSIANSLLDFEGSIQAELEAELLLGKDINLEKARQFALQGETGKMSEEVLKNQAIMHAFETKNVIAQEAAAKALGMQRDTLADMIKQQQKNEAIRKFGAEDMMGAQKKYNDLRNDGMSAEEAALKVGDDALAGQLESASVAEKMAGVMARIQELFVSIATPILALVDCLMPVFNLITWIGEGFAYLGEIVDYVGNAFGNWAEKFGALGTVMKVVASVAVILAAFLAYGALAWIPVVGPVLGGIASATILGKGMSAIWNPQKAGDVGIDPNGGPVVMSPREGGMFQGTKNDGVSMSPSHGVSGGPSGGSNAALMAKLNELIKINTRIAQVAGSRRQDKQTKMVIEASGTKLGEVINQAEREIQ